MSEKTVALRLTGAQRVAICEWWDRFGKLTHSILAERKRVFRSLEVKGLVHTDGTLTERGREVRSGLIVDEAGQ